MRFFQCRHFALHYKPLSGVGILTDFPFCGKSSSGKKLKKKFLALSTRHCRTTTLSNATRRKLPFMPPSGRTLGPTHSCRIPLHTKPFSTRSKAFSNTQKHALLNFIFATTTRISTKQKGPERLTSPLRSLVRVSPTEKVLISQLSRRAYVVRFSAIHFQRCEIRPVGCYTLLGEYRLPWSSSGCLNFTTTFVGSR